MVKFASPSCVCFISFGFLLATICVWVWMVCSLHSVTTGSRDRTNVPLIIIIIIITGNICILRTRYEGTNKPRSSDLAQDKLKFKNMILLCVCRLSLDRYVEPIVLAGCFEMFQAAVLERYLTFSPTFRSEAFSTLSPVESRLQGERLH